MPVSIRVRVRYAECDMQGHVFNAHYLTWFDMAHTALLSEVLGRPYAELVSSGVDVVVAEAGVRYRAPAHFEDELDILARIEPPSDASLTSRFTVIRGTTLVAEGFLRHVCVTADSLQKIPWPEDVRGAFLRHIATDSGSVPA